MLEPQPNGCLALQDSPGLSPPTHPLVLLLFAFARLLALKAPEGQADAASAGASPLAFNSLG